MHEKACVIPFNITSSVNSKLFARILFSGTALKRHICLIKNSQLGHDLPTSLNNRGISAFLEGFIFTKHCVCEVS